VQIGLRLTALHGVCVVIAGCSERNQHGNFVGKGGPTLQFAMIVASNAAGMCFAMLVHIDPRGEIGCDHDGCMLQTGVS